MDITQFKKTYKHKKVVENKNKVAENPLVTVCIQTYQHVDYIKECLDGILNQKTNFDFEILLGEDASTDGTREICIDYAERYPEKIRLFLHHRENNISVGGKPSGRFNFLYNLYTAQGKYIALCEGDDYWTDPLKLQKQVDFLEENEEHAIVSTNCHFLLNNKLEKSHSKYEGLENIIPNDLVDSFFIHTNSIVFKKEFLTNELIQSMQNVPFGDYPLVFYLTLYGKHHKMKDYTGVYRKNGGVYSSSSVSDNYLKIILTLEGIKSFELSFPYHEGLSNHQSRLFAEFLKSIFIEARYSPLLYNKVVNLDFINLKELTSHFENKMDSFIFSEKKSKKIYNYFGMRDIISIILKKLN